MICQRIRTFTLILAAIFCQCALRGENSSNNGKFASSSENIKKEQRDCEELFAKNKRYYGRFTHCIIESNPALQMLRCKYPDRNIEARVEFAVGPQGKLLYLNFYGVVDSFPGLEKMMRECISSVCIYDSNITSIKDTVKICEYLPVPCCGCE
jgi:hypothetical protein